MAANNAGRAGGGGAGAAAGGNNPGVNNEHVEFSVKAEEDLFLTGAEHTLKRVTAETNYSCLMLKTQRFSSLFRHYAKYHGLRKDDLEYYFVNVLENEDTPETVQLQRGDTIMVCAL
jgi:speckle-type POZ protein